MIEMRSGSPRVWPVLCAGLTLLILWLSLMPAGSVPSGLGWDKLNHAVAIAVATVLAYLSLRSRSWAAAGAFLYGFILGGLIEILQGALTTNRSAEWGDLLADLVGAGCTLVAIKIYQRRAAREL